MRSLSSPLRSQPHARRTAQLRPRLSCGRAGAAAVAAPEALTSLLLDDLRASWVDGEEQDYTVEPESSDVTGRLPTDLVGTFFRNSSGLHARDGLRPQQPLDGDGLLLRASFSAGRAHVRSAFVRTASFVAEEAAGRSLFAGPFTRGSVTGGLAIPFTLQDSIKNTGNTHVALWNDRLWALWEGAPPHAIDPDSLATLGLSDFGGAVPAGAPFAAHYKVLTAPGGARTLVNFGVRQLPSGGAEVALYEAPEGGAAVCAGSCVLPGKAFAFFHDAVVTPSYLVLFANPTELDAVKLMTQFPLGQASVAEARARAPAPPAGPPAAPHAPAAPRSASRSAARCRCRCWCSAARTSPPAPCACSTCRRASCSTTPTALSRPTGWR